MASNSVMKAITGNAIKHGACVVQRPLAATSTQDVTSPVRGSAWPNLAKIDAKYNSRFDDPRYYSGDTPA